MACALTLSLALPALAADTTVSPGSDGKYSGVTGNQNAGTQSTYTSGDASKNSTTTTFVGVINPTMIKATIPTQVTFDIDPTIDLTTTTNPCYDQVTEPTITITNGSKVPIYCYVTKVEGSAGITLTATSTDMNDAAKKQYVMFGLTSTAKTTTALASGNWMLGDSSKKGFGAIPSGTNSGRYYLDGASTCTAIGVAVAGDTSANVKTLHITAATTDGWKSGEAFSIKPTFVVSVKDPTATGDTATGKITVPAITQSGS